MKCVFLLLCVVVTAYSELCFSNGDCKDTSCKDSNHHVICASRECTCSTGHNGHNCTTLTSCSDDHCRFGRAHCVDGHCHCTFDGIFGGIGR